MYIYIIRNLLYEIYVYICIFEHIYITTTTTATTTSIYAVVSRGQLVGRVVILAKNKLSSNRR